MFGFFKNLPKCQMAILQSFRNQPTSTKIKIRMNVCLFTRVLGTFQHWKHPGNEQFSSSRWSRYILKLSRSDSKKTYDLLHLNINLIIKCKIQHLNVDPIIKCKICQKIPIFVYIKKKWNYMKMPSWAGIKLSYQEKVDDRKFGTTFCLS